MKLKAYENIINRQQWQHKGDNMKLNLKKFIKEKVMPLLAPGLENAIKPMVEIEMKKQIELHSDQVVEFALNELKELIPGTVDDNIINAKMAAAKEKAKKYLLAKADLISDKV
jgi:hypothetical protein